MPMRINALLNKLEEQEQAFLSHEILAPVLRGRPVGVQIAGVRLALKVGDSSFEDWAVLRPLSLEYAQIVRAPTLSEVAAYLRLLPAVSLIVVARRGRRCYALPAQRGDRRLHIERPVPLALAERAIQPFDVVRARFDGRLFLYERRDDRRNPALAAYLRESLRAELPADRLARRGLSAEERESYAYVLQTLAEAKVDAGAARVERALAHAGARLVELIDRDDCYTVSYQVDGTLHTSTMRKRDLTIMTAGICLSDEDAKFDLTSLVSVLRESYQQW